LRGWPENRTARSLGFSQYVGDFVWRANVVSQFDARSAVTPKSSPQTKDHPAGLEEAHLIVWLMST